MASKKNDSGWTSWALIIFLFAVGLWPLALFLLFTKLFASDGKKPQQTAPPLWETSSAQSGTARKVPHKTEKATDIVHNALKSPMAKKSNAKILEIVGVVLAVLGMLAMLGTLDDAIYFGLQDLRMWLPDMLQMGSLAAAGGGLIGAGVAMDRSLKRYAKYLTVLGDRSAVSIDELARTLGYSERRVEKDLQKMLDKGYFGDKAYLNMELGYLFRSSQADAAFQAKQRQADAAFQEMRRQAAAQVPKEAEEGYSGILRNIRRANDEIADPVLSAKIDRLEDITAKIFQAVEKDPKKKGKIGTFLNYYLPTTQKLLDSYASFEAAGVEGENLREAKSRIESTMDAIVRGFEHQLDELYKADAMDVASDIQVMEHMLRRDTGTVRDDFGLDGGSAAQQMDDREIE